MKIDTNTSFELNDVRNAAKILQGVAVKTPLQHHPNLSKTYGAEVYLKREDMQPVRSYKIRGAYHKIASLLPGEVEKGVVCASAGNHAQGVAYSCALLGIKGVIYMPVTTPKQKIKQVEMFGREFVTIVLEGDTFDAAKDAATRHQQTSGATFVHPFDDMHVIQGQATIGLEILEQATAPIDYLFLPIGGGGLAAGVTNVFKILSPNTKVIGVEPAGAPAMYAAIQKGKTVKLEAIDKFVDGAAVLEVGKLNFSLCKDSLTAVATVEEGKVCETLLDLYNLDAMVVEPAGALSIAVLEQYKEELTGKNVVCIVSGSNNDITRTEEMRERALLYQGLKHYFMVRFPQRSGALRDFLNNVLGPNDDITHFNYSKKHNQEMGPALIGIELANKDDFKGLCSRMKQHGIQTEYVNDSPLLFQYLG